MVGEVNAAEVGGGVGLRRYCPAKFTVRRYRCIRKSSEYTLLNDQSTFHGMEQLPKSFGRSLD